MKMLKHPIVVSSCIILLYCVYTQLSFSKSLKGDDDTEIETESIDVNVNTSNNREEDDEVGIAFLTTAYDAQPIEREFCDIQLVRIMHAYTTASVERAFVHRAG